jgi:hypothetical protein
MSSSPPAQSPASPTGRVVDIKPGTGRDATGNFVTGKQVTFQLATGQTGSVFVPDAIFDADSGAAAVKAAAAKLVAGLNLTF